MGLLLGSTTRSEPAVSIYARQQEEGVELWSRENLPLLKATRPAELYVGSLSEGSKVDVKMLKRLGEDVGKTVTNLSIDQLQAANVDELMEALSLFADSHWRNAVDEADAFI